HEQLVLVRKRRRDRAGGEEYIHVDWGPVFAAQHGDRSAHTGETGIHVGFGPLALAYLLRAGGSGYFRRNMVMPHIEAGRLELVEHAPGYAYPAYAVYPEEIDQRLQANAALAILRNCLSRDRAVADR